jgi:hypothetical protein
MLKNMLVSGVMALVVVGAAVATNPGPEAHRERIRQAIEERHPIAGILGLGSLTALVSSYQSVGVASYTLMNERLVTVGAFGMVFLWPKAPQG